VPEDDLIIRRYFHEVNGSFMKRSVNNRFRLPGKALPFMIALVCLLVFAASTLSCSCSERSSEKMYRKAMQLVDDDNLDEAVKLLDVIANEYPETAAADKAGKDLVLYRGLAGAVNRFSTRQARDIMVRTARKLETYRMKRGRLPDSLEDVVPETPVDPWGNRLHYDRKSRSSYSLGSYGADGIKGGLGEDADLLIRNGRFTFTTQEAGR